MKSYAPTIGELRTKTTQELRVMFKKASQTGSSSKATAPEHIAAQITVTTIPKILRDRR